MTLNAWVAILVILEIVVVFGFILTERRHPSATLAWVMAVVFLPVLGLILYVVFGRTRMVRRSRRFKKLSRRVRELMRDNGVGSDGLGRANALRDCDPRTPPVARLASRMGVAPPTDGNITRLLVDAEAAYGAMLAAIRGARHHIHIEFYIWQNDDTGRCFRDALVLRARDGVKVRALVDAVGSSSLPDGFFQPLVEAGGEFAEFSPIARIARLLRRSRVDFRNHRKLLIVDAQRGFTGGVNLGDEYLGKDPELGGWRDTHLEIEGPAVMGLQQAFVEDWLWATDELLAETGLFSARPAAEPGDAVLVVESGPDREWAPIHRIYVQAITASVSRVWLTNPYFLPDKVMEEALVTAALRGVDVRILLPKRNDSRLVAYASAAFFQALLQAGVKLYRYRAGFVHAKTLVVDDWASTVGSANMDARSFRLNFELNVFVFSGGLTTALAETFERDLAEADPVTREAERAIGYLTRLARQAAQLLSPLM